MPPLLDIPTTIVVGYCASCAYLRRWACEHPTLGLGRYGRCLIGVRPPAPLMMCHRYIAAGREKGGA